ncbi:MAG: pilus assembly PilX N-terminal domain-containing protein, partial [Deltaproteobacteria bacterium]|nr:pilus assembly PilX N-terminal domain-containing protein [Deltaproteobacteria bacterium]
MQKQRHINHNRLLGNEKGMVLAVTLMLIAVLVLLGTTAVMTITTDLKIAGNYRSSTQAFYIAEAGVEQARAQLKNLGGFTLSQILAARVGANGSLSNSTDSANFYANGAFVTDDVPYITQTSFGGGTCVTCGYRVYLTNDATAPDVVTSTTDTNLRVTLTSFGQGPNNSLAVVQEVIKQFTLPPLPGAITLPGPGVSFQGGNSNASSIAGGTESAITTTSLASNTSIINQLTSIGRIDNYTCNPPPCINNEEATIDPTLNSSSGLEGLYNTLMSMADVVTGTTTGATATTTTLTAAQVGTTSNRKIVVVNGNAVLGPVNGAGILIVTGQLTLDGNFNYNGLIMCIGQGNLLRNGGGSGDIVGSILVARTRDASNNLLTTLGNSTYNTNGGGNSDIIYNANAASLQNMAPPFI